MLLNVKIYFSTNPVHKISIHGLSIIKTNTIINELKCKYIVRRYG